MNRAKIVSAAKYGGTSAAVGGAITTILIHFVPALKDITEAVAVLVIFAVNMALAMTGVISDSE